MPKKQEVTIGTGDRIVLRKSVRYGTGHGKGEGGTVVEDHGDLMIVSFDSGGRPVMVTTKSLRPADEEEGE